MLWFGPSRVYWSGFSMWHLTEVSKRPGHQGKREAVSHPCLVLEMLAEWFSQWTFDPVSGSCLGISWNKCDFQVSSSHVETPVTILPEVGMGQSTPPAFPQPCQGSSSVQRELFHLTLSIDWLMSHLFAEGYSALLPLLTD